METERRTLTEADLAAIAEGAKTELARRNLIDFGLRCFPGFKAPPHVRLMANYLERLERGEITRLLVAVSVRHGKSVLCSMVFPSYFCGRNPAKEVVLASYAADLAERNSRIAKGMVESALWPFPDVQLSADSKAISRWNVTQGGGCRAIGTGGGITGHGADALVIDDPHATASSEVDRESAWQWYRETVTPRLNGGAVVVLVSARFNDDDLAGRILASEEANKWTVLRLPAICDSEDDPLGRPIGAALWPQHMSLTEIESRRIAMGSAAFSAQFQQSPVPAGGAIFKKGWFENRYAELPKHTRQTYSRMGLVNRNIYERVEESIPLLVVTGLDAAAKTGVANDCSALVTVATDGRDYFIVDVVRERLEFADLVRRTVETYERHRPRIVYVEDASSGTPLIQELKRLTRLPIVGVPPRGSKIARAEAISALFEARRVRLPERARLGAVNWIEDYIAEFCRFPVGKHDDMVDATSLAITSLQASLEQPRMVVGYDTGFSTAR
ncbi:MAG TPA: phage terminase large subunit [Candidatus Tumulicola sp.]|jgi:predicted phage terminase large subunit-like protein